MTTPDPQGVAGAPSFILKEPWSDGKRISERVSSRSVQEVSRLLQKEPISSGNSHIFCCMDARGAGKTELIRDAAAASNLLHLYVDLRRFPEITSVARRVREGALVHNVWSMMHGRSPESELQRLFGEELKAFDGCLLRAAGRALDEMKSCGRKVGMKQMDGGRLKVLDYTFTSQTVDPVGHNNDANGCNVSKQGSSSLSHTGIDYGAEYGSLWSMLGKHNGLYIVVHFDEMECMFVDYEQAGLNNITLHSEAASFWDRPSVMPREDGPCAVFQALADALWQSTRDSRVVWVYTGRRPSVIEKAYGSVAGYPFRVFNLSEVLSYLDASEVFQVLKKHAHPGVDVGETYDKADPVMKFCVGRLVGPPRVVQCLFEALQRLQVRDKDDMYEKWASIECEIVRRLGNVYLVGLADLPRTVIRECCLVPHLERLRTVEMQKFPSAGASSYWNTLCDKGIVRLAANCRSKGYVFELPYLMLSKVLCDLGKLPLQLVEALAGLVECKHTTEPARRRDALLRLNLVGSLAEPRPKALTRWLSKLGIASCLSSSSETAQLDFDCTNWEVLAAQGRKSDPELCAQGQSSGPDALSSRHMPQSAETLAGVTYFGASLKGPSGQNGSGERVCVALLLTSQAGWQGTDSTAASHVMCHDQADRAAFFRTISALTGRALALFEKTRQRTLVVFGGPRMPELTDSLAKELYEYLPRDSHLTPSATVSGEGNLMRDMPSSPLALNQPLPQEKESTADGKTACCPFSLFYVSRVDPIWTNLIISAEHQDTGLKEIGQCIVNKFLLKQEPKEPEAPAKPKKRSVTRTPSATRKRRATLCKAESIDEVIAELEKVSQVPAKALAAFKKLLTETKRRSKEPEFTLGNWSVMDHTDLTRFGVSTGNAKLLLFHVDQIFDRSA